MNYSNNAFSVIVGAITNASTIIALAAGTGSRFPAANFRVTLVGYDALGNENAWEICHCVSRTGDVLTVQRGQEGTTALAWADGSRIENRLTAGSISGGITYARKTSAYTLLDKEGIIADTSGGAFTVKLPASPEAGMQCFIADGSDWAANNLTVDPQGAAIENLAAGETVILNAGGLSVQFLYDGSKWNIYASAAAISGGAFVSKSGDTMAGALNWAPTVALSSAATTDIGAAGSNRVQVTGTTTITSLGSIAAGACRTVTFAGALTLTHNATSLILPGGTNIVTAAGDVAEFESLGSGNWRCTGYMRAGGDAATALGLPELHFLMNL